MLVLPTYMRTSINQEFLASLSPQLLKVAWGVGRGCWFSMLLHCMIWVLLSVGWVPGVSTFCRLIHLNL